MKEIVCDNKIVYKKNFIERLYEKLKGKKITLATKEIFEFKELPFFFRNKRRYSKHVKNVLSIVKKNIDAREGILTEMIKETDECKNQCSC